MNQLKQVDAVSGPDFDVIFTIIENQKVKTMKIDKYTKVMLTVIAICLVNLSLGGINLLPQAHAAPKTDTTYGLVPLNADGSITVRLSSLDEIDVNITDISTSDELKVDISEISTSDELDINIDEVGGGFMHMGEGIPVKIKK